MLAKLKPNRFNFSVFGATLELQELYCWCIIISVEKSLLYESETNLSIDRKNQKNQNFSIKENFIMDHLHDVQDWELYYNLNFLSLSFD